MNSALELIIAPSLETAPIPEELKIASVDVTHCVSERFTIDSARALQQAVASRSVSEEPRVFVIVASVFTIEAQNALLKLFEEVPNDVQLYIVVPHESVFIPTLLSRFVTKTAYENNEKDLIEDFLKSSLKDRLATIQEKAKNKDWSWMEGLVVQAAQYPEIQKSVDAKKSLALVESYLRIRGASRKMLLEELALTLPAVR